jgi:hypothetical protein
MLSDLSKSIIFIHGLSGSGKGEIYRKLAEKYSSNGYEVIYVSSGALFRAALEDPIISHQLREGRFIDTLGAIMPGIESSFSHFLDKWIDTDGKSVLILDGLIRRGEFTNSEGKKIPSQAKQIAEGLGNAVSAMDKERLSYFPELNELSTEESRKIIEETLIDSIHIVTDVSPLDAEHQMISRADKEMHSIKQQLNDRIANKEIDVERAALVEDCINRFSAILHGGYKNKNGEIIYLPPYDWNDVIDSNEHELLANEVKKIRESLVASVNLESSVSISAALNSIGVDTELRDDDISPLGRKTRIENYIQQELIDGETVFKPGFAAQVLCDDIGFKFVDGRFYGQKHNDIVVENGQSREVTLEQFRTKCEFMSGRLYNLTESARELVCGNPEGNMKSGKEKWS